MTGRAFSSRTGQWMAVTALVLVLAMLMGAAPGPEVTEEPDKHVYTVLISGIDSREGLVDSSLSDVNILATVNTKTRQVLMVSTPRDYFVPFSNTGKRDKLTHAGYYGIDVCMGTIGALYGVDIDYYFRVDFQGFVDIIDTLGGVTVESDYAFSSRGYDFVKGENELDGAAALAFARERKAFVDGDRQRGRNQMALIRAFIKKALSLRTLLHFGELMEEVKGSFETTVPVSLMATMVRKQLDGGGKWDVVSCSVTGSDAYAVSPLLGYEVYVMVPDETTVDTAKDLMAQVQRDELAAAP